MISSGIEAYIPKMFSCKSYLPALYIPTREDVRLLLSKMDKPTSHNKKQKRLNKECKVLFLLYFCCGLRLSEGRLLKYEHIDIEKGLLTITGSKGNKNRLVYFPNDGIGIQGSYMSQMQDDYPDIPWLFPGNDPQKPISCAGVEACFNRYWAQLPIAKHWKNIQRPAASGMHLSLSVSMTEVTR